MTNEELRLFAVDHLMYERTMFHETAMRLKHDSALATDSHRTVERTAFAACRGPASVGTDRGRRASQKTAPAPPVTKPARPPRRPPPRRPASQVTLMMAQANQVSR